MQPGGVTTRLLTYLACLLAVGQAWGEEETVLRPEVIFQELGSQLMIRAEADSFEALRSKVRPDFSWKNCLFWIRDAKGAPVFEMDEAFGHEIPSQPLKWALIEILPNRPFDEKSGWVIMGNYVHETVQIISSPKAREEGLLAGSWATLVGSNSVRGAVYEVGWASQESGGTGHYVNARHVYFLRDVQRDWHFIGAAELASQGKAGNRSGCSSITAEVQWIDSAPLGVQVQLVQETGEYIMDEGSEPLPKGVKPGFIQYFDYVLRKDEAGPKRTKTRPYLISEKGDSYATLFLHVGFWTEEEAWTPELKAKWKKYVQAELTRINSVKGQDEIPPGTRVYLLTGEELGQKRMGMNLAPASIRGSK